jgi:hypothetical protein
LQCAFYLRPLKTEWMRLLRASPVFPDWYMWCWMESMKITFSILSAVLGLTLCAQAQSSGGSPGSKAANNGGFSQPPTLAPATTPSAANPGASNPQNVNPNVNGSAHPSSTMDTNGGGNPGLGVTNGVNAFGDTNGSSASGFGTNNGVSAALANHNNAAGNPQGRSSQNANMNAAGDVTNANGTVTFNTNKARWWEK